MTNTNIDLATFDADGALAESGGALDGDTRGAFFKKAAIAAGGIAGSTAFLGGLPSIASAASLPKSDVAILNFALTLEYLEAAFYAEALKSKFAGDVGAFTRVVAAHEKAHVAFLKSALGSAAVKSPAFDFKGTTSNKAKFMATAQVLEDTGVAAYLGQAGNIKSKKILGAAASVMAVEARHAGWIRNLNGVAGAPVSFQGSKTKAQILTAVKGTGFIVA
ncbi:MAG TPA: ferritin-like domain-containing protein [Baekduia sp.]|nr:ferritin-like domain-containing protein [Baekduia sp.]